MDASVSKRVAAIEAGGQRVPLASRGAVVYDETLGRELMAKYKGSADVVVAEKDYVGLVDTVHRYTFTGVDVSKLKPSKKTGTWEEVRPGRLVLTYPAKDN